MSCILNIETATNICSVAVSFDGKIIFEKENTTGPSHAALLGVFVAEALEAVGKNNHKLDAVAVSCGPGSYTGLRIGVSEAKGLCYGFGIPLIAVKSLEVMAKKVLDTQSGISEDDLLCPMIDARRMEVYAAIYNSKLEVLRDTAADIVDNDSYRNFLDKQKVVFFGNGAEKCKDVLIHDNAVFIDGIYPSAKHMIELSEKAFNNKFFVDVAYFEPFYLKDFVATTPKKNLL